MTQESANVGRHLNSKKTKIVTTKEIYSFNIDNEDLEVVQDFVYLGWVINSTETAAKKSRKSGKWEALEEWGKIIKSKDVSLDTKAKLIHTLIFPVTMDRCESWAVKKADRKKVIHLEYSVGGKFYRNSGPSQRWTSGSQKPWTIRKMNKWVPEQIQPKTLLEAKMMKLLLGTFCEGRVLWKRQ